MILETMLKESISSLVADDILYPIDDVLKNSLSCEDCYDLETVIRPRINIKLGSHDFAVMPLAIICSNHTDSGFRAAHAEMATDNCFFSFPNDLKSIEKEIKDLIEKPVFANALYRILYRNLHIFCFDEMQNKEMYKKLIEKFGSNDYNLQKVA